MAVNYGQVAIVPKGVWNAETQYKVNNLVEYDGSSYVAKVQPPVGTLPTDTSYWQVSAAGTKKATADSLGTVMPDGTTTEIKEDGKLSAKTAQQNALGVVKGSDDVTVGEDGNLTVNTTFEQATEIANIIAGEAIKSVLGKVSKAIATTMSLDENALLKNMISGIDVNDGNKVPSSAYIHSLVERIGMGTAIEGGFDNLTAGLNSVNNNLSKRLLVGNNIASADLSNDMPDERFGTLSMRFSDGTINQLILLKDTANVSIFKDNKWIEQYRFATTSMLSDYVPKSDLVASSSDIQSKQNITDSSNIKFYKYGKIVVAHIQITTTSNLSGYDTLKVGVAPNGFKPLYECRSVVLMQQTNVSRILAFTTYGDINLWNWSSDSSITTPSGSALNGFAVYCVA